MNNSKTKTIEIDGRTFLLKKMDAKTGCYIILTKVMSILPGILENLDLKESDKELDLNNMNLTKIFQPIFSISKEDFNYIQDSCLKTIDEILPAGPQSIMQTNGEWGVSNIEDDIFLVMDLTFQSLWFNLQGFLKGINLNSILKNLNLSQLNMPT